MKHGLVFFTCLLMVGCAALRPIERSMREDVSTERNSNVRQQLIRDAESFVGTPYRYGGTSVRGFDCSGLVYTVYRNQGIAMPRSTSGLASWGTRKSLHHARAGDLAFFKVRGKVNHVAIVTKCSGKELWVIHSTTSRGVIQENILASSYWSRRFDTVRDGL